MFTSTRKSAKVQNVYAKWDSANTNSKLTPSNNDLTLTVNTNAWSSSRATISKSTGKWQWQPYHSSAIDGHVITGIVNTSQNMLLDHWLGETINSYGWYGADGRVSHNGNDNVANWGAWTGFSEVIVVLDLDANTMSGYIAGVLKGTINIAAGTYFPAESLFSLNKTSTVNFGSTTLLSPIAGVNLGVYT